MPHKVANRRRHGTVCIYIHQVSWWIFSHFASYTSYVRQQREITVAIRQNRRIELQWYNCVCGAVQVRGAHVVVKGGFAALQIVTASIFRRELKFHLKFHHVHNWFISSYRWRFMAFVPYVSLCQIDTNSNCVKYQDEPPFNPSSVPQVRWLQPEPLPATRSASQRCVGKLIKYSNHFAVKWRATTCEHLRSLAATGSVCTSRSIGRVMGRDNGSGLVSFRYFACICLVKLLWFSGLRPHSAGLDGNLFWLSFVLPLLSPVKLLPSLCIAHRLFSKSNGKLLCAYNNIRFRFRFQNHIHIFIHLLYGLLELFLLLFHWLLLLLLLLLAYICIYLFIWLQLSATDCRSVSWFIRFVIELLNVSLKSLIGFFVAVNCISMSC